MILLSGVGPQASITASQMSLAKSNSVPVKLSGEYSSWILVSGIIGTMSLTSLTPFTAISVMPARSMPNTTRRCNSDVEL